MKASKRVDAIPWACAASGWKISRTPSYEGEGVPFRVCRAAANRSWSKSVSPIESNVSDVESSAPIAFDLRDGYHLGFMPFRERTGVTPPPNLIVSCNGESQPIMTSLTSESRRSAADDHFSRIHPSIALR